VDFLSHPAFWICVAAASELIALSPLKDNSIVQLGVSRTARHPSKKALISFGQPWLAASGWISHQRSGGLRRRYRPS
jgi:hypothetical protein